MLKNLSDAPPATIFSWIVLLFGVTYLFAIPPYQVPDEPNHMYRAFQLSDGIILTKDAGRPIASVPLSLVTNVNNTMEGIPFHPDKKVDWKAVKLELARPLSDPIRESVSVPNTGLYSPVMYLPQVLGVALGRALDVPSLGLLYLARICNFACSFALLFLAFKFLRALRWTFLYLALLPMTLSLLVSASADATIIALCFLLFSLLTREFLRIKSREKKDHGYWLMLLILIPVMLCKQTYAVYAAPVGLLFLYRFYVIDRNPRFFALNTFLIALAVLGCLYWTVQSSQIYVEIRGDVDSKMQLQLVKSNVSNAISVLSRSLYHGFFEDDFFAMLIGRLGWLDAPLRSEYMWMLGLGMIVTNLCDRGLPGRFYSWLCFGSGLVGLYLLALAMYLTYTPTAAPFVQGIQGRYFIPLWPLLGMPFALSMKQNEVNERWLRILTLIVLPLGLVGGIHAIVSRWY